MASPPPPTAAAGLDPFVVWDGNGTEPPPDYPSDDPNENITCNQYIKHNTTFIIYGGYEGVPLNLGANVLLWLVSDGREGVGVWRIRDGKGKGLEVVRVSGEKERGRGPKGQGGSGTRRGQVVDGVSGFGKSKIVSVNVGLVGFVVTLVFLGGLEEALR